MHSELRSRNIVTNKNTCIFPDDIINCDENGLFQVKVSGPYQNKNKSKRKIGFDIYMAMFGFLSMVVSIAQEFRYGTLM
jgi:hypothetical protein